MLGNVGEKVQTTIELAEDLYEKVTALREDLQATTETVEDTNSRVAELESEIRRQGELLEAIAEEQGIDVAEIQTASAERSADGSSEGRTAGGPATESESATED